MLKKAYFVLIISLLFQACSAPEETHEHYIKSVHERVFDIIQYHDRMVDYLTKEHNVLLKSYLSTIREGCENLDVAEVNLDSLMFALNVPRDYNDLNMINPKGEIINSTTKENVGNNLFEGDEAFKRYLKERFSDSIPEINQYSAEENGMKLYKRGYINVKDGEYLIQIKSTTRVLNEEQDFVQRKLIEIEKKEPLINSIRLFELKDDSMYCYSDKGTVSLAHRKLCDEVILYKESILRDENSSQGYTDTEETIEKIEGVNHHTVYSYVHRDNSFGLHNTILQLIWRESQE